MSFDEFNQMRPSVDLEYSRGLLSSIDLDGWAFYNAPPLSAEGYKAGYRHSANLASDAMLFYRQ